LQTFVSAVKSKKEVKNGRMKSRAEILNEFVKTNISTELERFPEIVSDALRKDGDVIRSGVVRAFESVCAEASERQEKGTLDRVSAVSFSFLRTKLVKGKGVYRIDVRDESGLADDSPCCGHWEAAFAFEPYFRMAGAWKNGLRGFGGEYRDAHADWLALAFGAFPQLAVNAFLANVAPLFAASLAYAALTRAEGCAITAGEYGDFQAAMHEDAESGGAA
jgi:hypothetical protein